MEEGAWESAWESAVLDILRGVAEKTVTVLDGATVVYEANADSYSPIRVRSKVGF